MISSKAIDLIQTFSEDEFRKFGLFINSPYFNREAIHIKFYGILKKYYPEFDNKNFDKEKVFAKLYPGKKYNDGVMRNILSAMLELGENFLAIENLKAGEFNYNLGLMRELSIRKLPKLYERQEKKASEVLENTSKSDLYYFNKSMLINEKRKHSIRQKSSLYLHDEYLHEIAENNLIAFLISILRNYTQIANSNLKLFKFDYRLSFVNDTMETYLDNEVEKYKDIIYLNYFYNAFKLAKTEDEKYFYALKEISNDKSSSLSEESKSNIFSILTNYCYLKINKGELKFSREQFLLHKEQILRGQYLNESSSTLNHIKYMSVAVTGLDAGEIEWVSDFIEKYKYQLDNNNRENTYNFSRALLFYHRKQYSDALDWAAKVKTDDLSYKHQLKSLYLKIYFDMNETEPFYSHVDSYKHFLMNQKHIPEITRDVIWSYVNFTKKLFDIKNNITEKDFELVKLKKELTENKSMINKVWLLEKAEEIEKSRD
jgi:hypothetical protein